MEKYTPILLDVIQKPFVMDLLVYIGDNPDCSKNQAIGMGGSMRTRYLRLVDMEEWGLIDVQEPQGQHNACKLRLTDRGQRLYEPFNEIMLIAEEIQREEDGQIQSQC